MRKRTGWVVLAVLGASGAIGACVSSNNGAPAGGADAGGVNGEIPPLDSGTVVDSGSGADGSKGPSDASGDASLANEAGDASDAGPPVVEAIGQVSQPDQLVADPNFLYVTETIVFEGGTESQIVRCPIAGCGTAAPTLVAGNLSVPGALAISGSTLFWTEGFSAVKSCDVTTVPCTSSVFYTDVEDAAATYPTQLWVSAGNIYWMDQNGNDRAILACPVAGCTAGYPKTVLYASTGSPLSGAATSGLALDGNYAYITLFSGGPILRYTMTSAVVIDPTSEVNLGTTTTPSGTHVLDLDGTALRWAESGNGEIAACTAPSCTSVAAAVTGRATPYAVAHDATYIYGVDKGTQEDGGGSAGVLWRVAKP